MLRYFKHHHLVFKFCRLHIHVSGLKQTLGLDFAFDYIFHNIVINSMSTFQSTFMRMKCIVGGVRLFASQGVDTLIKNSDGFAYHLVFIS